MNNDTTPTQHTDEEMGDIIRQARKTPEQVAAYLAAYPESHNPDDPDPNDPRPELEAQERWEEEQAEITREIGEEEITREIQDDEDRNERAQDEAYRAEQAEEESAGDNPPDYD